MIRLSGKVSAIFLFLGLGMSVGQGQVASSKSSLEFDVREVPFSCEKSALTVCENRRSKSLALTDVRYALFGRNNEIFRFYYMRGSEPVQAEAMATPSVMSLSTGKKVFAKACFESPKIFRVQGKDIPLILKLDARLIKENIVKVTPQKNNTYHLENKNRFGTSYHILSCQDGKFIYDRALHLFSLYPSAENSYTVSLEESDSQWNSTGTKSSFTDSATSAQQGFDAFLSKIPSVPGKYKKSRELSAYILWSCIIDKGGNYKRPGMLMSKNWMHYIWSWDHCFNAMACSYGLPETAWDNYITVFDAQDTSGRLPDVLGYARMDRSCLKAPIHGWTLKRMQKEMKLTDTQLKHAYVTLKRWTDYWFEYRDSNKNGIPEYIQANDCWDNGTEFNINGDPNYIANRESATLSTYLVSQTDQLHDMALQLGKKDEAAQWKKKSDHLLAHMLDKLWDGKRFLTINIEDGSINQKSRSSMRFIPFFLGEKLPAKMRAIMIKDLREGGYLTDWGVATESIHSPFYKYNGYWTGPIWAPTTLIMVDGLKRAGEHALAKEIAKKFCDMCVKSGLAENFDPKTGEALRDKSYTWTASVFLILAHEYLE